MALSEFPSSALVWVCFQRAAKFRFFSKENNNNNTRQIQNLQLIELFFYLHIHTNVYMLDFVSFCAFEILHTNVICWNSRDEHLLSNIISSKSQSVRMTQQRNWMCKRKIETNTKYFLGVDRKRLKHHFGARYTCVHVKYLQVVQSAHMFVLQTQI